MWLKFKLNLFKCFIRSGEFSTSNASNWYTIILCIQTSFTATAFKADMFKTLPNPICVQLKGNVRAIFGAPRRAHTRELPHENCLLKSEKTLNYISSVFAYRSLNNLTKIYFTYRIHQLTTKRSEIKFLHASFKTLKCCRQGIMMRVP